MKLRAETQAALNHLILRTLRHKKLVKQETFWGETYKLGDKLTLRRDGGNHVITAASWAASVEGFAWYDILNDASLIHELELVANPDYAALYEVETKLTAVCRALVDQL